jgi:hypothetical protein
MTVSFTHTPALRRTATVTVTALCVGMSTASAAFAWRNPTRRERAAITKAAKRTPTSPPHKKVHVSHIHVSTVGPWASAKLTIYFGSMPDTATDILHKVRGKWVNDGDGSAGEWCVMPRKDQRNLGFPTNYPCP